MIGRVLNILLVVLIIAAAWIVFNRPDWIVAGPWPTQQHVSTVCSQFQRGQDEYGNPLCGHVTSCPYGDSIPIDSPKCAPADLPDPIRPHYQPQPFTYDSYGNKIMAGK